jgi:flagellar hook-length control protein FliK
MSTPIPTGSSVGLQSNQTSNPISETLHCDCIKGSPDAALVTFKDILADENLISTVLDDLKEILSGEDFVQLKDLIESGNDFAQLKDLIEPGNDFAQLKDLMESGNDLPLAAIVSPESPLFTLLFNGEISNIPPIIQQAIQQDGSQIPPFTAPVLKMSEELAKQGADAAKRQIAEVVTALESKVEGYTKQLQDLLGAVKTELAVTDVVPKTPATLVVGSEAPVTPTTNINSAISGLAQLSNFQASGGSPLPPAIAAPLGEEGWSQAMGDRIMWMIGKGVQSSSIRINPPNLGPIQVHVSVQNDQASVNILAQHGAVKEALEAAIPRLREMLHESNLQLVNVDVSHRENMQQDSRSAMFQQDHREHTNYFQHQEQVLADPVEEEIPRYYTSSGLLDDYA